MAVCFAMSFLESARRTPALHRVLQIFLAALLVTWGLVSLRGDSLLYHAAPVYFV